MAVSAPARPRLVVESLDGAEIVVGSRRVRLVDVTSGAIELAGAEGGAAIRLRATPLDVGGSHVHLKGLSGFLRRVGGRYTGGLDVTSTVDLEVTVVPGRTEASGLRVVIGTATDNALLFALPEAIIAVPFATASWVVLLVPASGRDAILLHRPARPHVSGAVGQGRRRPLS
jgi:hypothetical protein